MENSEKTPDFHNWGEDGPVGDNCSTPDEPAPTSGSGSDINQTSEEEQEAEAPRCNPEPPAELVENRLIDADTIGDTVFSKHWLFTVLMKLIQAVNDENENKESSPEEPGQGLDLDDELQDELCKLWDMSMNQEVVTFLQEFKALDILTGAIGISRKPRATEICVGILGNMACSKEICLQMANMKKLRDLMFALLDNTDAPTLVETTRLLRVCLSTPEAQQVWVTSISEDEEVFERALFILQSSTNNDLLKNTAEFVDKVMDIDEGLCSRWSTPQLIRGILEAVKQVGSFKSENLEIFLHILQLISTCEPGVSSLVSQAEEVSGLLLRYVRVLCEDEILVVDDQENAVAAAMSILTVITRSWHDSDKLITEDYHLLRCTMKFLSVVSHNYNTIKKRKSAHNGGCGDTMANRDHQPSLEKDSTLDEKKNNHSKKLQEGVYDSEKTLMLYDLIQNQLMELIKLISQLPDPEENVPLPKCLQYLETLCPHERLDSMVMTFSSSGQNSLMESLLETARRYKQERTQRILTEAFSHIGNSHEVT